jgi:phosphatidylglycerophosphatase C
VRLAIFDLDGTITRRDSFVPFVAGFLTRHPSYSRGLWRVPAALLRYAVDGGDRGRLKESLIVGLLGGVERATLEQWTIAYVDQLIGSGARTDALARIREHRGLGDRLVLLSASPDFYVNRIGQRLGFDETIATSVRWNGDRLDGRLTSMNRRGEEKARCLQELRARNPSLPILAFGNSSADFPHLQLADEGWLISDRPALVRRALALGLRTAAWH